MKIKTEKNVMLKTCDSAFLHFAHRINFGELPYFLSHCFVVLLHRLLSLSSSKMTQFLRAVRAQCCPQYSSLCGCTSCRLGLGYARRSYSSQRRSEERRVGKECRS